MKVDKSYYNAGVLCNGSYGKVEFSRFWKNLPKIFDIKLSIYDMLLQISC